MNNRHKYFRNLRYKQSLETRYNHRGTGRYGGWTGVYFVTDEVDPRDIREQFYQYQTRYWKNDVTPEEYTKMRLEDLTKKSRGHDYYLYYDRPEVKYSIIENKKATYGSMKSYYKKYSNRIVRHSKDILQHNQYRKQFDLWWTID